MFVSKLYPKETEASRQYLLYESFRQTVERLDSECKAKGRIVLGTNDKSDNASNARKAELQVSFYIGVK